MTLVAQAVISSVVTVVLTMGTAYLLYRYRQRPMVSVEIVVNTRLATPTIDLVITNHGRSSVVITELNVYVPVQEIIPNSPPTTPPNFKRRRSFFRVRRKLSTHGSKCDLFEILAESSLSKGAAIIDLTQQTETIRIEPKEKAARTMRPQKLSPYSPKLEAPNPVTLVPSCKIASQRYAIWGPSVIVGHVGSDEHSLPMVISPEWK